MSDMPNTIIMTSPIHTVGSGVGLVASAAHRFGNRKCPLPTLNEAFAHFIGGTENGKRMHYAHLLKLLAEDIELSGCIGAADGTCHDTLTHGDLSLFKKAVQVFEASQAPTPRLNGKDIDTLSRFVPLFSKIVAHYESIMGADMESYVASQPGTAPSMGMNDNQPSSTPVAGYAPGQKPFLLYRPDHLSVTSSQPPRTLRYDEGLVEEIKEDHQQAQHFMLMLHMMKAEMEHLSLALQQSASEHISR